MVEPLAAFRLRRLTAKLRHGYVASSLRLTIVWLPASIVARRSIDKERRPVALTPATSEPMLAA